MLGNLISLVLLVLILGTISDAQRKKSRTTVSTTEKPKHKGEHKLVTLESEPEPAPTEAPIIEPKRKVGKSVDDTKEKTGKKKKLTTTTTTTPEPTTVVPTTEPEPVVVPEVKPLPVVPKPNPPFESTLKGRSVTGVGTLSGGDPFSLSPQWGLFNRRMDNLTFMVIERMKPIYSLLSDSNEEFKANRTAVLETFSDILKEKHLKRLIDLLRPVDEELKRNQAFTVINPAIGLLKIVDAIGFAKTNSTKDDDRGKLKWLEVNAMAGTIHHIYKRLLPNFGLDGLQEINRTLQILYPSWVTEFAVKENADTFQDLKPGNLTSYIHDQMIILGEPNHLIRVLERLLNKSAMNTWDPNQTPLNMYCFGNNRNGQVHTKFDLLLDAALYLCLADMKFAILEMLDNMFIAHKATKEGGAKVDLEPIRIEIETRLKARVERKYRIAPELGDKDIPSPVAPKKFKCDKPPKACGETPHITAPHCPPGIYIQDGSVFKNGTKLQLPASPSEPLVDGGKRIDCIALEYVSRDKDGLIQPCFIKDGKCVNSTTGEPLADLTVTLFPVLVDLSGVPVHRSVKTLTYPQTSEWGISDCEIHADTPVADPDSPLKSCKTEGEGDTKTVTCGYDDKRKPNISDSTAQFKNAFPGYLESELVLSEDGRCIGTCQDYKKPTTTCTNKTTHCDLYRKSHCADKESNCLVASKCPNQARRCIRTSREVTFCPAKEGSGRMYEWLKFNDKIRRGEALRSETEVAGPADPICANAKAAKVLERWEMESGVILTTPQYCELCLCVCNDPLTADGQHHFDISPRTSKLDEKFVVTGLRFEQNQNVLSLNIQQGKIGIDGKIDVATLAWLPAPAPTAQTLVPLGSRGFLHLNLDEIKARFTEVVTGIKWRQDGTALSLEVGVTDYANGKLASGVEYLKVPPVLPTKRQRFNLAEAISPLNQEGPSQPYPITDDSRYFIEFDASSLEHDSGQSVIPFFDLQPITSSDIDPVPLSSVGILFKAKTGSGGFLAPSLRTFVYPYLREILP